MRIEEEIRDDVRILRLSGELDATDVDDVAARLDAASTARPCDVVLNLEGVRFATVAVLGSVLRAQRRARKRGGKLVISAPSPFVGRLVHAFGLEDRMRAYPRDDDAIRHLRAGRDAAHPRAPCTPTAA
ncbi:MAG TPA: STAS domain-containing protein [Planctomycetota bacterium]|nr:STAS domain-containing protein [Planctomycetota bacterium]